MREANDRMPDTAPGRTQLERGIAQFSACPAEWWSHGSALRNEPNHTRWHPAPWPSRTNSLVAFRLIHRLVARSARKEIDSHPARSDPAELGWSIEGITKRSQESLAGIAVYSWSECVRQIGWDTHVSGLPTLVADRGKWPSQMYGVGLD
jgi:hypothetical protein